MSQRVGKILFVMLHPGFIRYYEGALYALAAAGYHVHVAFEISRTKLGEDVTAQRLASSTDRITCGTTPARPESVRDFLVRADRSATRSGEAYRPMTARERREEAWESLATTVRLLLDYVRFFEPAFANAVRLRERAEKRLPRVHRTVVTLVTACGAPARRSFAWALRALERVIPVNPSIDAFMREQSPDLLLVTPLVELGSQQVDYVKSARRLGIRSALCVASWDNLTSKGLIRVTPDHVVVWNEAQKREAAELHGVASERVIVTGAQLFDEWFETKPSRSREEFCRRVGLDPARPFVLYVGSSMFIAPDEVPFAERWLSTLRASENREVARLGALIRPHPANSRQWRTFDAARTEHVAIWPAIGTDPNSADFRRDYFDSLYYSAGVVGINTSAQLEAAILDRPVFTICAPEFAHAQAGTLHFQHLVRPQGSLLRVAATLEEHVEQLGRAIIGGQSSANANREFVHWFIRPHGLDVPVAPLFVRGVDEVRRLPSLRPVGETWLVTAGRPVAFVIARIARALADDRPLWVYPLRPLLTAVVWTWAVPYRMRETRRRFADGARRMRRRMHGIRYELSQRVGKQARIARKRLAAAFRSTGVAIKRVARRAGLVPAGAGRKNA